MAARKKPNPYRAKARALVITALGHKILRAVDAGEYTFWTQPKNPPSNRKGQFRAA